MVFEEARKKINVFIKDETGGIMFSFHRSKRIKPQKKLFKHTRYGKHRKLGTRGLDKHSVGVVGKVLGFWNIYSHKNCGEILIEDSTGELV